jgi:iron complex transport system substrate-binding protein
VRIVSLVASATEIVAHLGLEASLVGVSADSDWPPHVVERLPVLNTISFDPSKLSSGEIDAAASHGHSGASLYHVDAELLRSLQPDLILTQEVCDVCSVSRRDLDAATELLGYRPTMLSLNAINLEEVLADIQLVADAAGVSARRRAAVDALRGRLSRVKERLVEAARGDISWVDGALARVFCMEWLDPPYYAGHWVPEMVELAGGRDSLGIASGPSREIARTLILQERGDARPSLRLWRSIARRLNECASGA